MINQTTSTATTTTFIFSFSYYFFLLLTYPFLSQIINADLHKLMIAKAGEDKANIFNEIMKLLGGAVEDALQSNLLSMVATQLQEVLPPKMSAQLEEKGNHVCTVYTCYYVCMCVYYTVCPCPFFLAEMELCVFKCLRIFYTLRLNV